MNTINGCKDESVMSSCKMICENDMFTLLEFCNFSCFSKPYTLCSQNINKRIVNIVDGNLTDYCFLSRDHYTKSKNYLRR